MNAQQIIHVISDNLNHPAEEVRAAVNAFRGAVGHRRHVTMLRTEWPAGTHQDPLSRLSVMLYYTHSYLAEAKKDDGKRRWAYQVAAKMFDLTEAHLLKPGEKDEASDEQLEAHHRATNVRVHLVNSFSKAGIDEFDFHIQNFRGRTEPPPSDPHLGRRVLKVMH